MTNGKKIAPQNSKYQYLFDQLEQQLREQKNYLNPKLTLKELAIQVNLPAYQLSQIINSVAEQRFFDFINSWRIQAFKEEIRQLKHYERTILSIALDCGFNSKAAFNRAFKKMEGKTPTEYINSIREAPQKANPSH